MSAHTQDESADESLQQYVNPYAYVRGFNYQPSYEATGYAIWRYFQPDIIDTELGQGKQYFPKFNTVRLWLSFDAFVVDPNQFAANFETMLTIAHRHELRTVPTLFNNWHSVPDFGGVSEEMIKHWFGDIGSQGTADNYVFRPYLEQIVGNYAEDERILVWDLCNEPFNNGDKAVFVEWLTQTYETCKEVGANQPIGVGIQGSPEQLELVDPISDVITVHPYFATQQPLDDLVTFAQRLGKPLLVTECCWGDTDDKKRAEMVASDLAELTKRGIGFLAHLLHETLVADGHRPQYGPISRAGYMAFIHMDGSLRAGHEIFNEY